VIQVWRKLIRKFLCRNMAMVIVRQSLLKEHRMGSLFSQVNNGHGLGLKHKKKYYKLLRQYNKARHSMILSFIIPPINLKYGR